MFDVDRWTCSDGEHNVARIDKLLSNENFAHACWDGQAELSKKCTQRVTELV